MGSHKRKTPEKSSPCLSPKKIKKDTKSETEMQGFPNDIQEQQQEEIFVNENQLAFVSEDQFAQQQGGDNLDNESNEQPYNNGEFHKGGMRVQLRKHVKQRLDELTEGLNFRFVGDTLEWLSPSETKTLLELTKKLGYQKGGETIDWLLSVRRNRMLCLTQTSGLRTSEQAGEWLAPRGAKRLLEVTRELGFSEVGQTVKCLIAMTRYKPILELTNLLGFQDCRKTLEWLLNQTKQNVVAIKNAGFSASATQAGSSAMNISPHFPTNQSEIIPVLPYQGGEENTVNSSWCANKPPSQTSNVADLTPAQPSQVYQASGILRNNYNPYQKMQPNPKNNGNFYNVGEINGRHCEVGMVISQPQHSLQFRSNTSGWPQENQLVSQFQANYRGLQGRVLHAESQFPGQEGSMQSNQSPNLSTFPPVQGSNSNILV